MLSRRLIERARRQRRFLGGLVLRNPLLRATALGARLLRETEISPRRVRVAFAQLPGPAAVEFAAPQPALASEPVWPAPEPENLPLGSLLPNGAPTPASSAPAAPLPTPPGNEVPPVAAQRTVAVPTTLPSVPPSISPPAAASPTITTSPAGAAFAPPQRAGAPVPSGTLEPVAQVDLARPEQRSTTQEQLAASPPAPPVLAQAGVSPASPAAPLVPASDTSTPQPDLVGERPLVVAPGANAPGPTLTGLVDASGALLAASGEAAAGFVPANTAPAEPGLSPQQLAAPGLPAQPFAPTTPPAAAAMPERFAQNAPPASGEPALGSLVSAAGLPPAPTMPVDPTVIAPPFVAPEAAPLPAEAIARAVPFVAPEATPVPTQPSASGQPVAASVPPEVVAETVALLATPVALPEAPQPLGETVSPGQPPAASVPAGDTGLAAPRPLPELSVAPQERPVVDAPERPATQAVPLAPPAVAAAPPQAPEPSAAGSPIGASVSAAEPAAAAEAGLPPPASDAVVGAPASTTTASATLASAPPENMPTTSTPPTSAPPSPRGERSPAGTRRARFEELGVRTSPPAPAPAASTAGRPEGEPRTAADIFNTPGPERDHLAWGRLLFGVAEPQQSAPPASQPTVVPLAAAPSPVAAQAAAPPPPLAASPLGEATRRFLQPLVGIDPASVPIYQGAAANAVAARLGADAVTVGEEIYLAAGNENEQAPATRALLAHELTHVAQRRQPRFVPPVARERTTASSDEETVALAAEARVRRVAAQPAVATPSPTGVPVPPAPTPASTPEAAAGAADWGGLPAPWEQLPAWLAPPAPAAAPASSVPVPAAAPAPTVPAPTVPVTSTAPAVASAPVVARAAVERAIEDESAPPAPAAPQGAQQQVPPQDIDALAKQVYAVLKQRLASERRRLG